MYALKEHMHSVFVRCLIRQSTDKETAWTKLTLVFRCTSFCAFHNFYGTSSPPSHFILDTFVFLQDATMCSSSSISSSFRQDKPRQLNCDLSAKSRSLPATYFNCAKLMSLKLQDYEYYGDTCTSTQS